MSGAEHPENRDRGRRGNGAPNADPFREARRPFWIAVIGVMALVIIAWVNGWIVPFWEH
jgi:hypothetical protein